MITMNVQNYSDMDGVLEAHIDFLKLHRDVHRGTIWRQVADFGMQIPLALQSGFERFCSDRAKLGFDIRAVALEGFGIEAKMARDGFFL